MPLNNVYLNDRPVDEFTVAAANTITYFTPTATLLRDGGRKLTVRQT